MSPPILDPAGLEEAKAEMNELNQKVQANFESLRTAPITELEKRINSLESAIKLSQKSAVISLEKAVEAYHACIRILETRLQSEQQRTRSLESERRANSREAEAKYEKAMKELDLAMHERARIEGELEVANRQPADLQKELDDVKKHSHDLQHKSDDAQKRIDEQLKELADLREQTEIFEAGFEAAQQRALLMENSFDTFRSQFGQFNDTMTALASSSMRQPAQTRPASAPSPPKGEHNSEKEGAIEAAQTEHRLAASQNGTAVDQNSRGQKRKASTERPDTSEGNATPKRVHGASHFSQSSTQPASPAVGEGLSPAQSHSEPTCPDSGWHPESGMSGWRGKITLAQCFDMAESFRVKAKAVSLVKSPSTFQAPWVELIPTKLSVQARRMPQATDDHLWGLDFDNSSDVVILELTPFPHASDKRRFARLYDDLLNKRRYANVSHGSEGFVKSFHLMPSSPRNGFPECVPGLDLGLASNLVSPDTLLLAVVFRVGLPEQGLVCLAWDKLIRAVRKSEDVKAIIDARHQIIHHSLPIDRKSRQRMSFTQEHMTLLRGLPLAPTHPTLGPHSGHFLSLSYSNVHPSQPVVREVPLPSIVFTLGGMLVCSKLTGLVVQDLQHTRTGPYGRFASEQIAITSCVIG